METIETKRRNKRLNDMISDGLVLVTGFICIATMLGARSIAEKDDLRITMDESVPTIVQNCDLVYRGEKKEVVTLQANNQQYRVDNLVAKQLPTEPMEVFTGVNLVADDRVFTPTDVNGKEVIVFASNGTTYLPIRAVADLLGIGITWDKVDTVLIDTTANLPKNNNTPYREKTALTKETITVNKGIKVKIDGNVETLTDANGNIVEPVGYQGTTYIPIRALASLLKIAIDYDGDTNTVFIGKHMIQTDPDIYNDPYQKEAQMIINQIEILIAQLNDDSDIFSEQQHKILDIQYNIIADAARNHGKDSDFYQELKPYDEELGKLYNDVELTRYSLDSNYMPDLEEKFANLESSVENANEKTISKYRAFLTNVQLICEDCSNVRSKCSDPILNDYISKVQTIIDKYEKRLSLVSLV